MPNKTFTVHTTEENIKSIDLWAERLARSRNFLMNQGIEMVLAHYDAAAQDGHIKINLNLKPNKKKAGAR